MQTPLTPNSNPTKEISKNDFGQVSVVSYSGIGLLRDIKDLCVRSRFHIEGIMILLKRCRLARRYPRLKWRKTGLRKFWRLALLRK